MIFMCNQSSAVGLNTKERDWVPSYKWMEMFALNQCKLKHINLTISLGSTHQPPVLCTSHFKATSDREEDTVDLRKNLSWLLSATDFRWMITQQACLLNNSSTCTMEGTKVPLAQ